MKNFLALAFVFAAAHLSAQVTLTQAEFPQAGDVYTLNMADTTGVLPGNSGTGTTWNFSTLNSSMGLLTDSFLNVGATPYGASYPQANLAQHQSGPGIDYFVYFDVNSAAADRVGNADTVNVITYSDPGKQYLFPLTYGTAGTDTYYAMYTDASSSNVVHVHGTATTNADGTGTLMLPSSATYNNVLRVHYTRSENDTVFTSSGNLAYQITENYYLWYIGGDYYPLLNIRTAHIVIGFSDYYQKNVGWRAVPMGIETPAIANGALNVFPNPVSDVLTISCPEKGTVQFYSADGKLLLEQAVENAGELKIDAAAFEPGVLLVIFSNEKMVLRKQLVIVR